jgi:hypothetical protein
LGDGAGFEAYVEPDNSAAQHRRQSYVEVNTMALTFDSTKTGARDSHEALENKEGADVKPTVDSVAGDAAKRAGERQKKSEDAQGIFTK